MDDDGCGWGDSSRSCDTYPEFQEQWAAELDRLREQEESGEPQVATEPAAPADLIDNDPPED